MDEERGETTPVGPVQKVAGVDMFAPRYSVTHHPVETLLTWVKSNDIAVPEIQRPFVWTPTKVRKLLDSLYLGYPIGSLITWRDPKMNLRDGTRGGNKRILIDGQQRVMALMAALLDREVTTKDYRTTHIRIAFHPQEEQFAVTTPLLRRDHSWIQVAEVFKPETSLMELTKSYVAKNPGADEDRISLVLEKLRKIIHRQVGVVELAEDLEINTVAEIFVRVNSEGVPLSSADFVMSKIAVNEQFGGPLLRKAIDYFCNASVNQGFLREIAERDEAFRDSDFFPQMRWLNISNEHLYKPTVTDVLRVAFTSQFKRGDLQELVALLSGRDFETRQNTEAVAEESFALLKQGVFQFIDQTHFERFMMILRSAGFIVPELLAGHNAVNFAYIVYLRGREEGMPAPQLERLVRRWYAMSILRERYSSKLDTAFEADIRQIDRQGLVAYTEALVQVEFPEGYWSGTLPQQMDITSAKSPFFIAYQASQVKANDKGFLSRDITVQDLLLIHTDIHHVYPRNHLKKQRIDDHNQVANFVLAQSEINIAISDAAPQQYFEDLLDQCTGGKQKYGNITDEQELLDNLRMNCLPESLLYNVMTYDNFLVERRALMAQKIKAWFESL